MAFVKYFVCILTAGWLSAHAHVIAQVVETPLPASDKSRRNTNLTVNAHGVLALSWATPLVSGYRIGLAVSTDNGDSWVVHDSISFMRAYMLGLQRRPTAWVQPNGDIVCSYLDLKETDAMPNVYVTVSSDGGSSWSSPSRVVQGQEEAMQDFSSCAQSIDGRLAISYLSSDTASAGVHVFVVTSEDGGRTWTDPVRVNNRGWQGNSCECCMTSVAFAPNGMLGVAFRANRQNVRDIHLALSVDGGVTFDDPVLIQSQPWTIGGCPATGPSLAFDELNRAHVSWRDYRDVAQQPIVYTAVYSRGSTAPPLNTDISSTVASEGEYPSIATSSDGTTSMILYETTSGVAITMVQRSDIVTLESDIVDPTQLQNANTAVVKLNGAGFMGVWTTVQHGRNTVAMVRTSTTSVIEDERKVLTSLVANLTLCPREHAAVMDIAGRVLQWYQAVDTELTIRNEWHQPVFVSIARNGNPRSVLLLPEY